MKARIVATGSYYPKKVVSNNDLAKIMDTNDEWITQRTGIKQRLFSEYNTALMGYYSALDALEHSTVSKEDIDLIIVATFTPDHFTPSCANLIYSYLELTTNIPTFDINAACSGLVYGLKTAQAFIESGMYKNILLIGSENISKHLDFNDRSIAILFGDGAGAMILQNSTSLGIQDSFLATKDDGQNKAIFLEASPVINHPFIKSDIELANVNDKLMMKGQEVFRFATKVIVSSIQKILKDNNLSLEEIKYIIPHQANARIIEYASKVLKIANNKFITNLDRVGNTSSASIILALDELNKQNNLEAGDKIILVAFGSGLTYGAVLVEW